MRKTTKRNQKPARKSQSVARGATPAAPKPSATKKATPARNSERSKINVILGLLRRKDGATIDDMMKATGWQAHSVRGALSGTIKKKLNLKVASIKSDGVRRYSIKA